MSSARWGRFLSQIAIAIGIRHHRPGRAIVGLDLDSNDIGCPEAFFEQNIGHHEGLGIHPVR
jgi:hypothetical protein